MLKDIFKKIFIQPKYKKKTKNKLCRNSNSPKLIMIGTPNFGNLGDHAIAEAEKEYIENYFPLYKYIELSFQHYKYDREGIGRLISDDDIILVHGGGYLGTLWYSAQEMVEDIILRFPNNKVIIFPQTIFFENSSFGVNAYKKCAEIFSSHKNLTLFVRDQSSMSLATEMFPQLNIYLVPDIVTYLEENRHNKRENVLFCIRNDKEKISHDNFLKKVENIVDDLNISYEYTDTDLPKHIDETTRKNELNAKFEQFSRAQLVVTDRLHGMLFCLITGTPCIALNNISKKVEGAYYWIRKAEISYIKQINLNELEKIDSHELNTLVTNFLRKDKYVYDNKYFRDKLSPIKRVMRDLLDE